MKLFLFLFLIQASLNNALALDPKASPTASAPAIPNPPAATKPAATGVNPARVSATPAASPANGSSALPAPSPSPSVITAINSAPTTDSGMDSILNEDLIKSLRDPFQIPYILLAKKESPKTDLEMYQLKDFKLNGVVTGPKHTRAMVTTPNNKVYFIKVGDQIGTREGKVVQILSDAIRVTEYFVDEHGKKSPDEYEINLLGEINSLTKKASE